MKLSVYKLLLIALFGLSGACGPVKTPVAHNYTLALSPYKHHVKKALPFTLLISKPEAMAGYRTSQMLYLKKPYAIEPFAKNAWESPPANMLYPLLVKRFQTSRGFKAISSSPYADKADYRPDTQLIDLYQDFSSTKSYIKFTAKIALTRVTDYHVLASKLVTKTVPCPQNTPYGGVLAANQAVSVFTEEALNFALKEIQLDDAGPKT